MISVLDYIPSNLHAGIAAKTDTTDLSSYIANAIAAVNSKGGDTLWFPAGKYNAGSTISLCPRLKIVGDGKRASILNFTHQGTQSGASSPLTALGATMLSGTGLRMASTVNSSVAVHISIRHISVTASHESNLGAGFYDTAGTFIDLHDVHFSGFRYQVVLDQSELVHIDLCTIDATQTSGYGIWLVNGLDLNTTAVPDYTNQITITRCQINGNGEWAIVDDGGYDHELRGNNFNGWANQISLAGAQPMYIAGCEFEASGDACIVTSPYRLIGRGTSNPGGVGNAQLTIIGGVYVSPGPAVRIGGLSVLTLVGTSLATGAVSPIQGSGLAGAINAMGVLNSGLAPTFDGYSPYHNVGYRPIRTRTGTAWTLGYEDRNSHVRFTSNSAVTVTVPSNATVPLDIGSVVYLEQAGTGTITVSAASGVTLRSRGGLVASNGQYARLELEKLAADEWLLSGDRA
jgi:hypothetical protein